ncbi:multiple epidermal growth factor-like domains protein 10 [Physella acuta]|uniref:multiple epidermal growth factor-like domains protein 10 n=1 Tax=Physella acuta TaxID=109671 RepID=UPI0027DDCB2E|nr:multiple epidermal growth factor-like domains protein 10 [Physella acuta]
MDCTIFLSALLFLSTVNISRGVCDADWFGSSCQFKCHCVNNQCDVKGKCTGGSTCDRGWFGPLCQYQDLTTVQTGTTTSNTILTDGNDATCASVQTFNVSWDISYEVTWLRVVLNGADSPQNIQVNLKSSSGSIVACAGQTPIRVYAQVTDIFCSNNITSSQVLVDFKANKNVCSVYISGGRNLALKQPTWQSSNYSDYKGTFYSTKAVDGNTNTDFYNGNSCSHTESNSAGSWMVNFTQPRLINRYVIYNRDSNQERLKGFNLTSYSSANRQIFTFKDTSSKNDVLVYNVTTATSSTPVSYVIISVGGILTLCEVETYGEYYCTSKTFGLECANTCNCNNPTETCFVATGGCRSGCPTGYEGDGCAEACDATYYGLNCTQKCSSNCREQLCNNVNGNCYNCYNGKQGALCDQDCTATYYGQNCAQRCSTNCTSQLCNNVDGTCNSCIPGRKGRFCDQDCEATYYGQNCAQRCSTNCTSQLCNNVDGTCNSCIPGKKGRFCDQDCEATYHGQNCAQRCSTNCTNQLCNNVDGTCNSCIPGKKGRFCDQDCAATYHGQNCAHRCSTNCTSQLCNNVDGTCNSCIPGKRGRFCDQDCAATYYGQNCTQRCSTNCTKQLCNNVDGTCNSCVPGKQGDFCDEDCDIHHYGENCRYNCSTNCTDSTCNRTTGECFSCIRGFQGAFCDRG